VEEVCPSAWGSLVVHYVGLKSWETLVAYDQFVHGVVPMMDCQLALDLLFSLDVWCSVL